MDIIKQQQKATREATWFNELVAYRTRWCGRRNFTIMWEKLLK